MTIQYVASWTSCTFFGHNLVVPVLPQLQHEATTNKRSVQSCLHGITVVFQGMKSAAHTLVEYPVLLVLLFDLWGREQHRIKN